jgi:hypothetical protein
LHMAASVSCVPRCIMYTIKKRFFLHISCLLCRGVGSV